MNFDELMRAGWKNEPAAESFQEWKARVEREIEDRIIACPKIRAKLIANAPRSSPESRPATPPKYLEGECRICERLQRLTRHHHTPREIEHLVTIRKGIALICRKCHDAVHLEFPDNMDLHNTDWIEVRRRVRVRLCLVWHASAESSGSA